MDEKKVKEAIEYLSGYIQSNINLMEKIEGIVWIGEEPCKTAIEALEKQLPKKGIKEKITEGVNKGLHNFYCPVCYEKGDLSNKCNVGEYCSDCGQRLDWGDDRA